MKNSKNYFFLLLTFALLNPVAAKSDAGNHVPFQCYSAPNQGVLPQFQYQFQAFEYASGDCGGAKSADTEKDLGKTGVAKDVVCMMPAACKPAPDLPDNQRNQAPPPLDAGEVARQVQAGVLKLSFLVCRGKGKLAHDGKLDPSPSITNCGDPTSCQGDVFYNFTPAGALPNDPQPVAVPNNARTP